MQVALSPVPLENMSPSLLPVISSILQQRPSEVTQPEVKSRKPESAPVLAVNLVPFSPPESPLLSLCEFLPVFPAPPFEVSIIPIRAHLPSSKPSSLPARLSPEVTQVESDSIPLEATFVHAPPTTPSILLEQPFEVMPADSILSVFEIPFAPILPSSQLPTTQQLQYLVPQRIEWQGPAPVYEVLSMLTLCLPLSSSPLLLPFSLSFACFSLVLWIVLVSAVLNVSKTVPTHLCNLWSEHKCVDSTQIGSLTLGNDFMHWLQSAQQTHRALHLVFDPGGLAPGLASPEDIHQLKQQDTQSLRIVPMCYAAVTTHSSQQIPPFPVLKP
jgi:hypothetical protein